MVPVVHPKVYPPWYLLYTLGYTTLYTLGIPPLYTLCYTTLVYTTVAPWAIPPGYTPLLHPGYTTIVRETP